MSSMNTSHETYKDHVAMLATMDSTDPCWLYGKRGMQFPGMILPGSVIVMYMDKGPSGPCGQSSSVMCDHASLLFFPNEERMRQHFDALKPRKGIKADLRYWVVG